MYKPNFTIVKDKYHRIPNLINEGSECRVLSTNIGDGKFLEKRHKGEDYEGVPDIPDWYKRQIKCKEISQYLTELQNPFYSCPKMFITHRGRIFEEDMGRDSIYKMYKMNQFSGLQWKSYVEGIANFINDLSEYKYVYRKDYAKNIERMELADISELYSICGHLPERTQETLLLSYDYLYKLPENKDFVFSHGDLHPNNVLIKSYEPFKIALIDYAFAKPLSKLDAMYGFKITGHKEIWDCVNGLPRTKNPKLTWNYNPITQELYTTLFKAINQMGVYFLSFNNVSTKKNYMNVMYDYGLKLENLLEQVKKQKPVQNIFALAPIKHYSR